MECELECAHCELNDEYCKEDINWAKVCSLLQDNPALCSQRDDWDWYPLHFACYHNAPFSAIEILIKIWPEGLNETVEMVNESDGHRYDAPALELACGAGAPDEVISVLAQTSRQLGYRIYHVPGEILMDMNRDLNLLKKNMILGYGATTRNICSIPKKSLTRITDVPSTACIIMIPTYQRFA
jgi:hypothetical protein